MDDKDKRKRPVEWGTGDEDASAYVDKDAGEKD